MNKKPFLKLLAPLAMAALIFTVSFSCSTPTINVDGWCFVDDECASQCPGGVMCYCADDYRCKIKGSSAALYGSCSSNAQCEEGCPAQFACFCSQSGKCVIKRLISPKASDGDFAYEAETDDAGEEASLETDAGDVAQTETNG